MQRIPLQVYSVPDKKLQNASASGGALFIDLQVLFLELFPVVLVSG